MCRNPTPTKYNTIKTIMDTGANVTVFHPRDTSVTKIPTTAVINAQGPNGTRMTSVEMGVQQQQIPKNLPQDLLQGHIIPNLTNHSILSMSKIVNVGSICTFDNERARCYHPTEGKICTGTRATNGLWYLDQPKKAKHKDTCTECHINAITSI